jgi:flavodoxin
MSFVKKALSLVIMAAMATGLASCSKKPGVEISIPSITDNASKRVLTQTEKETTETTPAETKDHFQKAIVVYFSCTGNTKNVALKIANSAHCQTCEIVASKPYTTDDLNYNNKKSRATKEQNDAASRPEISGSIDDWSSYDVVFLGYPIWFAKAPRILCTFVESHDFTGKTVIPFCTSGSSGIGSSATELKSLAKNKGKWLDGTRFASSVKDKDISEWLSALVEAGDI